VPLRTAPFDILAHATTPRRHDATTPWRHGALSEPERLPQRQQPRTIPTGKKTTVRETITVQRTEVQIDGPAGPRAVHGLPAGHWVMLDAAPAFHAALVDWLPASDIDPPMA